MEEGKDKKKGLKEKEEEVGERGEGVVEQVEEEGVSGGTRIDVDGNVAVDVGVGEKRKAGDVEFGEEVDTDVLLKRPKVISCVRHLSKLVPSGKISSHRSGKCWQYCVIKMFSCSNCINRKGGCTEELSSEDFVNHMVKEWMYRTNDLNRMYATYPESLPFIENLRDKVIEISTEEMTDPGVKEYLEAVRNIPQPLLHKLGRITAIMPKETILERAEKAKDIQIKFQLLVQQMKKEVIVTAQS